VKLSSANHILVTGAAGAIGAALVSELATRAPRAHLSLVDRDERGLRAVAQRLGDRARTLVWDLARPQDLPEAWAQATREREVDVLVNCAGIMELRSLAGMPWSLGEELLAIDLLSPMRLMTLAVPAMRRTRTGLIVNLSSLAGVFPLRGATFYGAAKAGLAAASEIAHLELAADGVHVVTVYPGPVSSGLERHARAQVQATLLARWMPVGDATTLARRIVVAAETGGARVIYPLLYRAAARVQAIARPLVERFSPDPLG
jgi:short-subunit dehydrogenase